MFHSSWCAYVLTEESGIDPPFAGVYRVAKQDETIESLNLKQGQRLFLHVASANMNVSQSFQTHVLLSHTCPNPTGGRLLRTPHPQRHPAARTLPPKRWLLQSPRRRTCIHDDGGSPPRHPISRKCAPRSWTVRQTCAIPGRCASNAPLCVFE